MLDPQSDRSDRSLRVRRYVVLATVLFLAIFLLRGGRVAKLVRVAEPAARETVVSVKAGRKVYPFSVIYGGAHSGEELARARKVDDVVARHYAGFGSSATVVRMPKDTLMYVSYRRSNQVFWTKTKHRIPKGETVLSDGANLARTRCGNRLSPKPQAPVASEQDPTEEALDFPDKPKAIVASANPAPALSDPDFFVPANPGDPVDPINPSAAKAAVPGIESEKPYPLGLNPGGGVGSFFGPGMSYPAGTGKSNVVAASSSNVTPNALPENGLVTPEPGTWPLLCVGVLLGSPALVRRWRARTNTKRK